MKKESLKMKKRKLKIKVITSCCLLTQSSSRTMRGTTLEEVEEAEEDDMETEEEVEVETIIIKTEATTKTEGTIDKREMLLRSCAIDVIS